MTITLTTAPDSPSLSDPSTFEARTSAFLAWMAIVSGEINGKVLEAGDFGLGQTGNTQANQTLNDITTGGVHQFAASDASNPLLTGGAVQVVRYANNWLTQIVYGATVSEQYFRRSTDNGVTWTDWRPQIAVYGSNSNGSYTQFPDGTMICISPDLASGNVTTALGNIFQSANVVWTYPASFTATPNIPGAGAGNIGRWTSINAPGVSNVSFRVNATGSSTANSNVRLVAVGRYI